MDFATPLPPNSSKLNKQYMQFRSSRTGRFIKSINWGLEWTPFRKAAGSFLVVTILVPTIGTIGEKYPLFNTVVAANAFADSIAPGPSHIEELEAKLDALVWYEESRNHVMKPGEIFQTFDPPQGPKWWAICTRIGGKVHQECYSNGPRQSKIPTIQGKWVLMYGVEISEKDAREVAEDNEKSRRFFLDCAVMVKGCANLWTGFRMHAAEGQQYIDELRTLRGIQAK